MSVTKPTKVSLEKALHLLRKPAAQQQRRGGILRLAEWWSCPG